MPFFNPMKIKGISSKRKALLSEYDTLTVRSRRICIGRKCSDDISKIESKCKLIFAEMQYG